MTGLDRLRGYARRMDDLGVWPGGAKLREIAEQIMECVAKRCRALAERGEQWES